MNEALDSSALQALRESTGGDAEFLADLVGTFLEECPGQLDELRSAVASGNAGDVRRGAHTLKSNGATFGIVRVTELCRELERQASEGNLERAEEQVAAIGEALAGARPALLALTAVDRSS
ncbi:MAG TPA: Hpt domain-containing protein [Thermoleophilaceae bacterium]